MGETFVPWALFVGYCAAIVAVTAWQRRRTASMQAYAVGNRDVSPLLVGLSLAANMTSVATFVINPGLMYAFGWAGVVGYGIAAPLGIFLGLAVTSTRFRRIGDRFTALTVPQWLGERYGDRRVTVFFAVVALLQVTFLVLIVTGLALVLMSVLRLPMAAALAIHRLHVHLHPARRRDRARACQRDPGGRHDRRRSPARRFGRAVLRGRARCLLRPA
jgi:SSS family solute:Na+ symporter/sodium/pantothenate symporter